MKIQLQRLTNLKPKQIKPPNTIDSLNKELNLLHFEEFSKKINNRMQLLGYLRNKNFVIVAGTGVSSSLTSLQRNPVVTWEGLLNALVIKLLDKYKPNEEDEQIFWGWNHKNVFEKADCLREFGETQNDTDYRRYILHLLAPLHPDINPDSIAEALAKFEVMITTTNYDYLLELKLNRHFHNMESEEIPEHNQHIFHINGVVHEATNIILQPNDETFNSFAGKIIDYCPEKSLLFVGCQYGALDFHFTNYYKKYPHLKHFILLRDEEIQQLLNDEEYGPKLVQYVEQGTLNVISYGSKYEDLVPFLQEQRLSLEV